MRAEIDKDTMQRIVRFGKEYKPALLPDDLDRGRLHWCFDDCIIQFTKPHIQKKYRYVEGIAKATPTEEFTLHAWITDGVHAFDPTWYAFGVLHEPRVLPGTYIGMEMPWRDVMMFMHETGYQGVIGNAWRNRKLAAKCLPTGFRITRAVHNLSKQQGEQSR